MQNIFSFKIVCNVLLNAQWSLASLFNVYFYDQYVGNLHIYPEANIAARVQKSKDEVNKWSRIMKQKMVCLKWYVCKHLHLFSGAQVL